MLETNWRIRKSLNSLQWILVFYFIFRKRIPNLSDLKLLMHIRYGGTSERVDFAIPAAHQIKYLKNPFKSQKSFGNSDRRCFERTDSFGMNELTIFLVNNFLF